jgi:hypothetical protein
MSPQVRTRRAHGRKPRTPDDPFATMLRRLRWPVALAWVIVLVLLHGLSGSLSNVTDDGASAYLPSSAASTKVVLLEQAAEHTHGQSETDAAIVVFARANGALTPADRAVIVSARTAVAGLAGHVAGLAAPGALQPSADGEAVAFTVDVTGKIAGDTESVAVTGPAAVNAARPRRRWRCGPGSCWLARPAARSVMWLPAWAVPGRRCRSGGRGSWHRGWTGSATSRGRAGRVR